MLSVSKQQLVSSSFFQVLNILPFHLTQEQVVAHLQLQGIEISRSSYSQIECGTYNIRISELLALANLFQTDINAFFKT